MFARLTAPRLRSAACRSLQTGVCRSRSALPICATMHTIFPQSRHYHSYPDPDEKPVIAQTKSEATKTLDKSTPMFNIHEKFKLDTMFPGTPVSKGIGSSTPPDTVTSKIENGLTVASQEMPGLMSTFALIVRCGSAYEVQTEGPDCNTGVAHFLELNAFRSTHRRPSHELIEEVERLGGMVQCIASRENIIYVIDVLREHAAKAIDILADSALCPLFPPEELEESRMIVRFQQDEMPAEVLSRDLVQMAGYKKSPLGNSHFCPVDKLEAVDAAKIQQFRSQYYFGGNCVLAAAGIDHDTLLQLAQDKFGSLPPGERERDGTDMLKPSTYTGGLISAERTLKEPFVKLAMAFETGGWNHEKLVAMCVMHQLLGGGSSFSAGGPGKGMYTRLYTQVLNRYYWAESVESFMSVHEHGGLFGIDGACPPDKLASLVRVIVDQLCAVALLPIPEDELSRAKNMLKSSMMMQLESRLVQCEDIARQLITYGKRQSPAAMCAEIEAVTAADVQAVAEAMMASKPAVGCVGHDISHLPSYQEIEHFTSQYYHDAWKRTRGDNKK